MVEIPLEPYNAFSYEHVAASIGVGFTTPKDVQVNFYHHHIFSESEADSVADAVGAAWSEAGGKDEL